MSNITQSPPSGTPRREGNGRQSVPLQERQTSRFTLRFAERKILLAVVDLLILNGTALLSRLLSSQQAPLARFWERLPWYILLLSGIWLLIGSFFEIYDLAKAANVFQSISASGTTVLITVTIYLLIPFFSPELPVRRLQIFTFFLSALVGIILWRFFYAMVFVQPAFHQRAIVIGGGGAGRLLAQVIRETATNTSNPYQGTGYQLVGFVDDDPEKEDTFIQGIPVLGKGTDLVHLVQELQPDELVMAITHSERISDRLFAAVLECREMGLPITTMVSLYEQMTGRVPVEHVGRDLNAVLPLSRPSDFRLYLALRRLFDIIVSLFGSMFLAVLIPFIWLANQFTSPGDLFYRQTRVGKGGKLFDLLKFRSMVMGAEEQTGAVWAGEDDSRVTLVGRFLRRMRLDEMPQFWNVLKGEMSLIGPRPERPEFVARLAEEIPFYRVRHAVKPGITGWAQVKYPYGASVNDSLVKLQYDLYYIKHQGLYLDLLILLKTAQVMLGMMGR